MNEFAKGGYIPSKGDLPTVKVRQMNGRLEYWEPELNKWVPILSYDEIKDHK